MEPRYIRAVPAERGILYALTFCAIAWLLIFWGLS